MSVGIGVGIRESVSDVATVTAPGAGAAIVTIASGNLTQGSYRVVVICGYGGTADVINNMELRKGSTVISDLYVQAVANSNVTVPFERIELDGTQALSVNATLAGAVNTVFNAMIVATKIK